MDQYRTTGLLPYFLRMDSDETRSVRLEELSNSDWEDLIQESARHGITPLLYHRLKTLHPSIPVPTEVVQRLRQSYLQSSSRNMRLYHKLGKVLEILRHENTPVIVLKGAHLAELVYCNIALRSMSDVDLLVHKADLLRVEAALLGINATPLDYNRLIGKDNHHFGYLLPNCGLHVEVHWNILASIYPFNIDIDGQWERSKPAIIAGVQVSVLCPEDLLLYLCLHTSMHLFTMGLKSLYDILETIRHYGREIDWKQIQLRSQQWGVEKCVYLTLKLARELLGASVPDDLMKAIKPNDFDECFMTLAKEQIFPNTIETGKVLSLSPNIAQLWESKGLLDKATLFLRRVFPSPEEMTRMYPAPSDSNRIYFYYLVRIRDLLLRHGRQVWRLLRRDEGMRVLAEQANNIIPLKEWLGSPD